ncbi:MAG: DUF3726 domain-containing protein [Halioglobus sp.]
MRVSRNELTGLLGRVFEGQGLIDFDAAAKQVVWLEQCGLKGLARLAGCINSLQQSDQPKPQLADVAPGQMSLDVGGNSTLAWGSTAAELLFSGASQAGFATLNVEHCRHRMFILQPLAEFASQGVNCLAHWQLSGDPVLETVAMFEAGGHYPTYQTWQSSASLTKDRDQSLALLCSEHAEPLLDYQAEQRDRGVSNLRQIEADALQAQYKSSLDCGLEVDNDFWETLCLLGERVLVEASDVSRSRGAGPAGN